MYSRQTSGEFVGLVGNLINDYRFVSLVGKVPVYRAGGSGSIPGWATTQGLKIIEENIASFVLTSTNG